MGVGVPCCSSPSGLAPRTTSAGTPKENQSVCHLPALRAREETAVGLGDQPLRHFVPPPRATRGEDTAVGLGDRLPNLRRPRRSSASSRPSRRLQPVPARARGRER